MRFLHAADLHLDSPLRGLDRYGFACYSRIQPSLDTNLAKKQPACLKYIVVHEITHFLDRYDNEQFIALMDAQIPQWRQYLEVLNSLPLANQKWRVLMDSIFFNHVSSARGA